MSSAGTAEKRRQGVSRWGKGIFLYSNIVFSSTSPILFPYGHSEARRLAETPQRAPPQGGAEKRRRRKRRRRRIGRRWRWLRLCIVLKIKLRPVYITSMRRVYIPSTIKKRTSPFCLLANNLKE